MLYRVKTAGWHPGITIYDQIDITDCIPHVSFMIKRQYHVHSSAATDGKDLIHAYRNPQCEMSQVNGTNDNPDGGRIREGSCGGRHETQLRDDAWPCASTM